MANSKVTPEEAQANAHAIRKLWKDGGKSLARLDRLRRTKPDALGYGSKEETFKEEAQRLGVNADTAAKMRRLAQDYAEEEVETICSLVVKHRSRFGPTHLLITLRVAGSNRRDKLVQKAIREGWPTSRLERAAQATKGKRREHVGRKPRVPDDPKERLLALDALAEKWCRWCDAVGDGLPKEVKALVSLATTAVLEVQNAVKKQFPDTNTGKKSKTAPP